MLLRHLLPRALPVLVLLAGLLGMHVVGGGVHLEHAGGLSPALATSAAHGAEATAHSLPVEAALLGELTSGEAPLTLAALCLAVLLTAAVAVALPRVRRLLARRLRCAPVVRPRTAAASRAPPRDLLAQLCVLRT